MLVMLAVMCWRGRDDSVALNSLAEAQITHTMLALTLTQRDTNCFFTPPSLHRIVVYFFSSLL